MSVAVDSIINDAESILQDTTNVRWPAVELLSWLNKGEKEVVINKPDASITTASVLLTTGSKQTLPSGGIMLIDITRNMGTTVGAEQDAGPSISLVDKKLLDKLMPTWYSGTGSTTVKHYMYDDRNPRTYYVYPKSLGTNYVELIYAIVPTAAAAGGNISVPDIYEGALLDYILYRAYSKNNDANTLARAKEHLQAFLLSVGALNQMENLNLPR